MQICELWIRLLWQEQIYPLSYDYDENLHDWQNIVWSCLKHMYLNLHDWQNIVWSCLKHMYLNLHDWQNIVCSCLKYVYLNCIFKFLTVSHSKDFLGVSNFLLFTFREYNRQCMAELNWEFSIGEFFLETWPKRRCFVGIFFQQEHKFNLKITDCSFLRNDFEDRVLKNLILKIDVSFF